MDYRNYRLGNLLREVNSGKIIEVIGVKKLTPENPPTGVNNYTEHELNVSALNPEPIPQP